MAITRAQQYKQMLQKGGRIGLKGGADMGTVDSGTRKASAKSVSISPGGNVRTSTNRGPDPVERNTGLETLRQENINKLQTFKDTRPEVKPLPPIGPFGLVTNLFNKQFQKLSDFSTKKNREFFENVIRAGKIKGLNFGTVADMSEEELEQAYKDYMSARTANEIDAYGNPITKVGDGPDEIIIPEFAQAPSTMEKETLTPVQQALKERGDAMRFAAEGGIMDLDTGRQMYGLGKLVKKVTRGIKKIAKSPIGKAALLYTGAGALGNLAGGSGLAGMFKGFTSPSAFLGGASNIFKSGGLKNILVGRPGFYENLANAPGQGVFTKATKGILGTGGKLSIGKAITAASLLPLFGIGTGEEDEEEAEELLRGQGIDIAAIRANPNQYLAPRFAAEGGIMRQQYQEGSKEPVAKKTMPLIDMGGMEKDYREDGGFVPIGRMEKADDVPARLSKNEFVFTADAVRNAGDGDVDKGAEVMYNMMKNLEAGGDVSEESQGLEGAREMFQTSKRLEEVL